MTEAEWLACEDPTAMLHRLSPHENERKSRRPQRAPWGSWERRLLRHVKERKLRLFAAVCCRRVQQFAANKEELTDAPLYVAALERHADGDMPPDEWDEVTTRARETLRDITDRTLGELCQSFRPFFVAVTGPPAEAALWASVHASVALRPFPHPGQEPTGCARCPWYQIP